MAFEPNGCCLDFIFLQFAGCSIVRKHRTLSLFEDLKGVPRRISYLAILEDGFGFLGLRLGVELVVLVPIPKPERKQIRIVAPAYTNATLPQSIGFQPRTFQ